MGLFDFMKKKEVKKEIKKTPEQKANINRVTLRHKTRIKNLLEETEVLSNKLITIEEDDTIPDSKKSKTSCIIIQRLTLIKYEIGIREDLISWL